MRKFSFKNKEDKRTTGYRLRIGKRGESIALRYYRHLGGSLIKRNFRTPDGELDLIIWLDGCLHFVEVKTRADNSFGQPQEQLPDSKLRAFEAAAGHYLKLSNYRGEFVFEICAIFLTKVTAKINIYDL